MEIRKLLKDKLPSDIVDPLRRVYGDIHYLAMHVVPEEWYPKRYDRNPLYIKMVDKYDANKYVVDIIGEEYIIPTLGVWNNFDE